MPETYLSVGVDRLTPDPHQPRRVFDREAIERLAASLLSRGQLQPLRVAYDAERDAYVILCGESRWRAAKLAGLTHLACVQTEAPPSEADLLADRLVENELREDLAPMDYARGLAKLKRLRGGCSSQALALELGLSASSITRAEALLSLPEDVQGFVDTGAVPESTAYELSRLMPDEAAVRELAGAVVSRRMSRDQAAEAVRGRIGRRPARPKPCRLACRLEGGVSITVSSGAPLSWEGLLEALDRVRRQAKKLSDGGEEVGALARALRAS